MRDPTGQKLQIHGHGQALSHDVCCVEGGGADVVAAGEELGYEVEEVSNLGGAVDGEGWDGGVWG